MIQYANFIFFNATSFSPLKGFLFCRLEYACCTFADRIWLICEWWRWRVGWFWSYSGWWFDIFSIFTFHHMSNDVFFPSLYLCGSFFFWYPTKVSLRFRLRVSDVPMMESCWNARLTAAFMETICSPRLSQSHRRRVINGTSLDVAFEK